jgi:hypothetical protein
MREKWREMPMPSKTNIDTIARFPYCGTFYDDLDINNRMYDGMYVHTYEDWIDHATLRNMPTNVVWRP